MNTLLISTNLLVGLTLYISVNYTTNWTDVTTIPSTNDDVKIEKQVSTSFSSNVIADFVYTNNNVTNELVLSTNCFDLTNVTYRYELKKVGKSDSEMSDEDVKRVEEIYLTRYSSPPDLTDPIKPPFTKNY